MDEKRTASVAILDAIEWLNSDPQGDFERGMVAGLKVAQIIAEEVEREGE